jgi:Bacteriophage related domain of unknown function
MGAASEILRALETRLATIPGLPDIAWPNIAYEPSPTKLYLRPNNLPVKPLPIGLADADDIRRDGLFQVDVFAPKNKGSKTAMDMAEAVNTLFSKGTVITTTSGYKIKITSVAVEEGQVAGSHFAVPVLVQYVAVTP